MMDREKTDAEARVWFDKLWGQGDPWDLEANPFEIAKYEAQIALLDGDRTPGPARKYGRSLEVGCAAGAFTRRLAPRCEQVLGIDIAQPAIALARERNSAPNVQYEVINAMEYEQPLLKGQWDLVVCAETLCYLGWLYPFFNVAWFARCLYEGSVPGARLLLANTCGGTEDWLLKPWVIRSYHDLFKNVGYRVVRETEFRGNKNGSDIEAMMALLEKPAA
jgi:SAM-dependent methyltransferase